MAELTELSTRIRQKFDTLENWNHSSEILLQGELAVAYCGSQIRFKIGNGSKTFSQLKFVDELQLSTQNFYAQTIAQGISAYALPTGFAAGINVSAESLASQAMGYKSIALSSDPAAFVWNGDDTLPTNELYQSHGKGTFNINALSGLSGIYFGDESVAEILEKHSGGGKTTVRRWSDDEE